jgi:hypothetical protein
MTCDLLAINLVPRHSYNPQTFVPGRQKTCHTLLPRPQKLYLDMRGYCPPSVMRRVTLTYSTAGPLGCKVSRPDRLHQDSFIETLKFRTLIRTHYHSKFSCLTSKRIQNSTLQPVTLSYFVASYLLTSHNKYQNND